MREVLGTRQYLGNSFSIQYMYRNSYSVMHQPHIHPFYEIYYLLKGERVYFMNGGVYTAKRGDMIIINPNDLHSTASSESFEFERILINFHHHFVPPSDSPLLPFERGSRMVRFSLKDQPVIERLMKEMLEECENPSSGTLSYVQGLLTMLLVRVYRRSLQTEDDTSNHHPMHQTISNITSFMQEHYRANVTLEQVAQTFFISPSYLSRIFPKLTGFHFREYLQVIRVREAQKKLKQSGDRIQLIAENVGFENIAHFNRTFKKITGVTPSRYREQHADDE